MKSTGVPETPLAFKISSSQDDLQREKDAMDVIREVPDNEKWIVKPLEVVRLVPADSSAPACFALVMEQGTADLRSQLEPRPWGAKESY